MSQYCIYSSRTAIYPSLSQRSEYGAAGSGIALVHRGQNLYLVQSVESEPRRQSGLAEINDLTGDLGRVCLLDQVEIPCPLAQNRKFSCIDPVGVLDNIAALVLPEDACEFGYGEATRADDVSEEATGPHGRKLIDVAKAEEVPYPTLIERLLEWVDDVVDELGSRTEVEYAHTILSQGTSADRQLAVYRQTGDFQAVVDRVVEETMEGLA